MGARGPQARQLSSEKDQQQLALGDSEESPPRSWRGQAGGRWRGSCQVPVSWDSRAVVGTLWVGDGGPGIGSPQGLPGPPPGPSHKALLCLVTSWSLEVWLPQGPP